MKKLTQNFSALMVAIVATLVLTTSCGGVKTLKFPCHGSNYQNSKDYVRYSDFAESKDLSLAKQKAFNSARTGLASMISTKVKAMTDNYVKNYVQDDVEEVRKRYEDISRQVINQELNGIKTICEEATENKGKYTYYVCLELTGEDILGSLTKKMSEDSKLRTDFDYEKFKKEFEKEMSNMQ